MFKFGKSVLIGLYEALKTDVNVFLIGLAALALAFQKGRGLGVALMFYTALRRADDIMGAYVNLKNQELSATRDRNAKING